jgi:hypothetical protein
MHVKVHTEGNPILTTNLFFKKEVENKIHSTSLYPKGPNPTLLTADFELKGDKDSKRRDELVMNVYNNDKGQLIGEYKFAIV